MRFIQGSLLTLLLAFCLAVPCFSQETAAPSAESTTEPSWLQYADEWVQRSIDGFHYNNSDFRIDRIYSASESSDAPIRLDITIKREGEEPVKATLVEGVQQVVGSYIILASHLTPDAQTVKSGKAQFNVLELSKYIELNSLGQNPANDFEIRSYARNRIDSSIFSDMLARKMQSYSYYTLDGKRDSVSEKTYYDKTAQSYIVEAKPKTHEKVEELIQQLSSVVSTEQSQASIPQRYRIEVLLLQSGASESSGEVAKLEFSREHPLQELNCEVGQMVEKGDVLAQLDMSEVAYDIQQTKTKLASAAEQFKLQETIIETMKQQFEAGRSTQIELNQKLVEFRKAQENIEELENQLEMVMTMRDNYILTAPFDGKITRIHRYPGQMAKGTILELSKIDPDSPALRTSSTATLLAKYGLDEDSFLPFEMDDLSVINRTVLDLYPEGNQRAFVELPNVVLSLQYLRYQSPFLITQVEYNSRSNSNANGRYSSDVFLESNKAGIVGFTNLDDATVLVLYWRYSGELPESDVSQRDSPVELSREERIKR